MKSMISKKRFIVLLISFAIIIIAVICMTYRRTTSYDKIIIKRYVKRVVTIRTISSFYDIQYGFKLEDVENRIGKPDAYWGSGIVQPQYYLLGGDSILLYYNQSDKIEWIGYLKDKYSVETDINDKMTIILCDRYRSNCLNKDRIDKKNKLLPISGEEVLYDPDKWSEYDETNYTFYNLTTSYNYALNIIKDPRTGKYFLTNEKMGKYGLHPGGFAGIKLNDDYSNIIECSMADAVKMGYTFKPIDENANCGEGNYKVALYVSKKFGDLWYRQNPDGTWSYKDAGVSDRDYDGDVIYNPREANAGLDVKFMGFFEVGGTDKIGVDRIKVKQNVKHN